MGTTVTSVTPTNLIDQLEPGSAAARTDGSAFASTLAGAVDGIAGKQATSAELALQAVSGNLDDVHDYTIAATEAAVALELTVALRNKAVDAFNEIMRMQA